VAVHLRDGSGSGSVSGSLLVRFVYLRAVFRISAVPPSYSSCA
jgi:hypothetical protein